MPSRKNHYQAESWSSPSCSSSSSSSDDSSYSSDLSDDWSSPDPGSPFCSDREGRTPPRERRKQEKTKKKNANRPERGRSSSKAKYKEPCLKDIEKKNRKKSPARTRSRSRRGSMAITKNHKRRPSKGTVAPSPPKTPPPVPSTPSRNVPVANGPGPSPFSPPEMLLPGTLNYQPYYQPPQRFTYATPGPPVFQHHQPAYYTTSPFQSPFSAGPGVPHTPAPPAFGSAFTPCAMPPSAPVQPPSVPVHTLSFSQQLFHTQAVLNSKIEELSHNPGNMGLQTQVAALRGYVNNIMDQTVSQHTVGPVASPLTGGGTSKPIEASAVSTPEMSPEPEKPEPPARHTCTNCGSLRSRSYHRKHPMKEGKPSFPSLCISCREEMQGRDVAREGDLQLCFGCGICRSRNFRSKNPIIPGQPVVRNYCSRCGDERLADERRAAEEAAENTETSSDASPPPPAPAMRHPVEQAPEPPSSPRTHSPSKHSSPVKSQGRHDTFAPAARGPVLHAVPAPVRRGRQQQQPV